MKNKVGMLCMICILLFSTVNTYALSPPDMKVEISKNVITNNNALLFAKLSNSNRKLISKFELMLYKYNEENEIELIYVGTKNLNTYDEYVYVDFNIYEDFGFELLPNTKYLYMVRAITGDGFSADGYSNGHNFTTLKDDRDVKNENIIETTDGWKYYIKENYAHIVKYNGSDTELTVPSVINDIPVKAIDDYSFAENDELKSIEISEGITYIGSYAFYDCSGLKEIKIPASVTEIEYGDDVGYSCFIRCHSLKNVIVNGGNTVFSSDDGILYNKEKTKLLFYPYNRSASDFVIPYGVKEISGHAFVNQRSLYNLTLSETVEKINPSNYIIFSYMKNINVDEKNKFYSSESGVLYNKEKTEMILLPAGKNAKSFRVPNNVKIIGDFAFYNCRELSSITISNGVEKIGEYSFYGCQYMTYFEIPATVTSIGNNAFGYCFRLEKVRFLGAKPTNLNKDIFSYALKSFVLSYDLAYQSSWINYNGYKIETYGERVEGTSTTAVKLKKAKIKYAKKKAANKIKISLKKINSSKGYQVAVYKSKKNAQKNKKALVKKFVKKCKFTIKSKKFKNKKTLYVKARAYSFMDNNEKNFGKWSAIKKVKMNK